MAWKQNPLPQLIPQRVTRLKAEVDALLWDRTTPLPVMGGGVNPVPQALTAARRATLRAVQPGEHFGPARGGWHQRWFRVSVPSAAPGERGRRFLHWRCHGETTVYHDGAPWAGLDVAHSSCPLPETRSTLWLDCSTWQTGIWIGRPERDQVGPYGLRFDGCSLRIRNRLAWDVSCDLDVLLQLMHQLLRHDGIQLPVMFGHIPAFESCSPLLRRLLRGLDQACDTFIRGGLPALSVGLHDLLRSLPAEAWQPLAALCGHAHLDLVWLWPEMATRRKAVHSFATQLRLMERYPEIIFVQSQPTLYRAVEQSAPQLMRNIRARIRQGRWEVLGAFEVEPDTNLPCGEALVRSLVCGQRKIAALRGRPSSVCWIPDVFGYSACLPQILHLGGVRHFFTTKMTWSQITKFPYNSFVWRGNDGSEVLAHLCSTGYNGTVDLDNLNTALRHHRQADVHPELLLPTGFGDGGGGLTELMCERARRLRNLAGAPRVKWTTTEAFFGRLEQQRADLPVYQGELYLEYHRGTLTTQSEFKRLYRAAETALQAHEAVRVATAGAPLEEADWIRLSFCQFHDALPGSSIGLVYKELQEELAAIVARSLRSAAAELTSRRSASTTPAARRRAATQNAYTVFNPLPIGRQVVVELPAKPQMQFVSEDGAPLQQQRPSRRQSAHVALQLPPLGSVQIVAANPLRRATGRSTTQTRITATPDVLDNGTVQARFDRIGRVKSLRIDNRTLELAAPTYFALYHDQPANFDAWDIDHYTLRRVHAMSPHVKLQVVEAGPVRAVLRGEAALGDASRMVLEYSVDVAARHLRVTAYLNWRESHRLLKFHVPTGYRGHWGRFGCPFGSLHRPQLPGTAADEAMWEVAGSRWAAVLHDDGRGLALCTEAKYGFACRDGDLSVSLLRSAKEPDPRADMGDHVIHFAIGAYDRETTATTLATPAAADALFAPVVVAEGTSRAPCILDWDNLGTLVPSWVMPLTGGGFVVRLHETAGATGRARLRLAFTPRNVDLIDFLGRRVGAVGRRDARIFDIPFRPYQILSLRVRGPRAHKVL